jgi:hypothetical protein
LSAEGTCHFIFPSDFSKLQRLFEFFLLAGGKIEVTERRGVVLLFMRNYSIYNSHIKALIINLPSSITLFNKIACYRKNLFVPIKTYLFVTSRTGNINSQTLFLEGKSPIPSLTESCDKEDGKAADDFEARVISCLTTPTRKLSGVFRLPQQVYSVAFVVFI